MKNNIDFRYEYSDLNSLHLRVEIIKGKYAGIILEFGTTNLMVSNQGGKLVFDYTIYAVPEKFNNVKLRGEEKFEKFLSDVLVAMIVDRNNDPLHAEKLIKAQKITEHRCSIKIDPKFYKVSEKNAIGA